MELAVFIIVYGVILYWLWLRKQKSKPEIFTDTYFKNLAKRTIELAEISQQLEEIDNMLFDLQHVPDDAEKQVSIHVPDTLTGRINIGKFIVNNSDDAEIFVKILLAERDKLRTSLLDGLNSALRNDGTETGYGSAKNTKNCNREEYLIRLHDHRRGERDI